jgi:hypothetical protein
MHHVPGLMVIVIDRDLSSRRAATSRVGLLDMLESSLGGSQSGIEARRRVGEMRWWGVTWPSYGSSSDECSAGGSDGGFDLRESTIESSAED